MHFLRAFLSFNSHVWRSTIRIYVDDTTMSFAAGSPRAVVSTLGTELVRLKSLMETKQVISNESKEQFYSPSQAVLRIWRDTHRSYTGQVTKRAKDLGAMQRGFNVSSSLRAKRLVDVRQKCKRIKTLRVGKHAKALVTKVAVLPSVLYACEVDPPTQSQLHQLRVEVALSTQAGRSVGNRIATLLLEGNGLLEPQALFFHRVLTNWRRQMVIGVGTNGPN